MRIIGQRNLVSKNHIMMMRTMAIKTLTNSLIMCYSYPF